LGFGVWGSGCRVQGVGSTCAATKAFDWFISADRKSAMSSGASLREARVRTRGTWV